MFLLQYTQNITCYDHPHNEAPVRVPIDLHQNFVDGVGFLVPAIVLLTGGIAGMIAFSIIGKRKVQARHARNLRNYEQRVEAQQRR